MKKEFDIIINDYLKDNNNMTDRTKSYHQALLKDLPEKIGNLLSDNNYLIRGSYGQGTKAECPCLCIFNRHITTTAMKGIYICFLWKSDMSGFYLTLNQGITYFKEQYGKDKYTAAVKTTEYFRKQTYSNIFTLEHIDLVSNTTLSQGYEATTVRAKYYAKDHYSGEELVHDLQHMIFIYQKLYEDIEYITYEKIVDIIVNGNKRMLEQTSSEEIMKLHNELHLLDNIAALYHVTRKELDKIRKEKGIGNIVFENYLRDNITIIDHFDKLYPIMDDFVRNSMITSFVNSYISLHNHADLYLEKFYSYDWSRKNIPKLIQKKGIDLVYRNKKLADLYNKLEPFLQDGMIQAALKKSRDTQQIDSKKHLQPAKRKEKTSRTTSNYPRDPKISNHALYTANYQCAIDPNHPTFIRRTTYEPYMEPHHLIPLEYQDLFPYSLDVEANIVSLCSNCHNEIHYGIKNRSMIKRLYHERKEALKACGIVLENVEQLYQFYNQDSEEPIAQY